MAAMSMVQALNSAIDVMLGKDDNVVVFGEDVGFFGGVFRVTEGLQQRYGEQRVFDAPIAEGGQVGIAIGMGVSLVTIMQYDGYVDGRPPAYGDVPKPNGCFFRKSQAAAFKLGGAAT